MALHRVCPPLLAKSVVAMWRTNTHNYFGKLAGFHLGNLVWGGRNDAHFQETTPTLIVIIIQFTPTKINTTGWITMVWGGSWSVWGGSFPPVPPYRWNPVYASSMIYLIDSDRSCLIMHSIQSTHVVVFTVNSWKGFVPLTSCIYTAINFTIVAQLLSRALYKHPGL